MAEVIVATGSEELMEKSNRLDLGLYDNASDWLIPLRAKVNRKSPDFNHFLTPFKTDNTHFTNPGLDLKKAIYVLDDKNVSEIKNTLPEAQWKYILKHRKTLILNSRHMY